VVHNQHLDVFNHLLFGLHIQHHWRCFPTNHHAVNNYHQLNLDEPSMVHDQLFLFHNFLVHLHIQHNRRRLPTNHYTLISHHQLVLDATAVVHNQLHNLIKLYIQHDR
jgi:hypothetical protein